MDHSTANNFSELCKATSQMLEMQLPDETLRKYMRVLNLLCCGPPGDQFSARFGALLTQLEMIDVLLNVECIISKLLERPDECRRVVLSLLNLTKWSKTITKFMEVALAMIMSESKDETIMIIKEISCHRDLPNLPVEVGEIIVSHEPLFIERSILSAITGHPSASPEAVWLLPSNHHWVSWSSKSSLVFICVTSILNELLIQVPRKGHLLKVIRYFITAVQSKCGNEQRELFTLYPVSVRALVVFLVMKPGFAENWFSQEIIVLFEKIKSHRVVLALLSHFPDWEPFYNENLKLRKEKMKALKS